MRKVILLMSLLAGLVQVVAAQQKAAYVLYDARGRKVSYEQMAKVLEQRDIILFGEYHNNPISHWLQYELVKDMHEKRKLILGAEMFEADNQSAMDQYLRKEIDQQGLDTLARLWNNYETDYAPLVNFARDKGLVFAATNIPRRYASQVARGGFEVLDTLSETEKGWIAPLPVPYDAELPGYKAMLEMMGGHGGPNLPKAQAIKDATMAHFTLQYYQPGSLFIHFNGAYHSDNYEGILWYLRQYAAGRLDLRYATISTVSQADNSRLLPEHRGRADYIICVDEDMTTTY